jgi:uncharacterized protein YjeT (DUF2065 family)
MEDLFTALGLVLVIEGALYALFPEGMQRMMKQVMEVSPAMLRGLGLAGAVFGFVVVWLIRR